MDNNFYQNNNRNNNGNNNGNNGDNNGNGNRPNKNTIIPIVIAIAAAFLFMSLSSYMTSALTTKEITYNQFIALLEQDKVDTVVFDKGKIVLTLKGSENSFIQYKYWTTDLEDRDISLIQELKTKYTDVNFKAQFDSGSQEIIFYVIQLVIMFAVFYFIFGMMMKRSAGGKNGIFGVGKSNAKVYIQKETGVTFKDVAGQDEAKESVVELVDFLHNPGKYAEIGAKLPKGALLVGPPGTGKTLLAKAVAGEAKVPFFSLSGSDFVELYVGVGASRVRDLFKQAEENAPCIIFIDEIDSIGKSRDSKYGGGNDEREQTLNALLAEMDGFDSSKGILILAATNRPEVLDPALLRPGRFDRRVIVDTPDLQGRLETLKVHSKDVKMDETVNLEEIALATSGAVGSDLANMINEAAINAVKAGRKAISQADLFEAVEVVIAGKEKKNKILGAEEKKIVAYHEVGHALVTAVEKDAEPVQKITIVPRTHGALGYVMQVPEEEKFLKSKEELEEDLVTFMAGRAAEEIVFHSVTTGASNDIEQATRIARAMVAQYGMSERFGLMGLATVESQYLDGEARLNCGEETAAEIDKEVMKMLKESYEKAKQLLSENREVLDKIAAHLYEKENITGKEFMKIYRELKGIPEPEEENVAKQGSSVDFRVGEEATHTVDLNKATSEKEESEEEDPNKENSREEDFEQETDV